MTIRSIAIVLMTLIFAIGPSPVVNSHDGLRLSVATAEAGFTKKAIIGGLAGIAAKKGFEVCLRSQQCRAGVVGGGLALTTFLSERYGRPAAERCAANPACFGTIRTMLADRGVEAAAVMEVIKTLMTSITDDPNVGDKDPSTPIGGSGNKTMEVGNGTNQPTTIGGRRYGGHALDQMQGRGIPPSAVEDAIENGQTRPDKNNPETRSVHVGQDGRVTVVTDMATGTVITVIGKGRTR